MATRSILAVPLSLLIGMAGAGWATAQESTPQLQTAHSDQHGEYLTDGSGRALYMFTADQQGGGSQEATSNCYEACATAWPPLLGETAQLGGSQMDPAKLRTIQRKDGSSQITYNGWPLYYYFEDEGPGKTTGQDVHGFGGEWYLLTPEGEKLEGEG